MRRLLLAALVALFLVTPALAQEKPKDRAEPTLKEKLQGKWSKTNHEVSFEITGNKWTEYHEAKPLVPFNTGTVEYPLGKDYVIVNVDKTGNRLWIFSAGKDVVAVETFMPDGRLWEDGRIFYRFGTVHP